MKINNTYTACAIVEGFSGVEPTERQTIQAWAYLIKTGTAFKLQGWYGRNANALIESGVISRQGKIDWGKL